MYIILPTPYVLTICFPPFFKLPKEIRISGTGKLCVVNVTQCWFVLNDMRVLCTNIRMSNFNNKITCDPFGYFFLFLFLFILMELNVQRVSIENKPRFVTNPRWCQGTFYDRCLHITTFFWLSKRFTEAM